MIRLFFTFSNNILQCWEAGQNMGASSGHHVCPYTERLVVFFNEQDNLKNFLNKTNLLKHSNGKHPYLGNWQHSKYFCSIFQGFGFNYHQRNVRSRSRTSRSRSRLEWQSLSLGGYGPTTSLLFRHLVNSMQNQGRSTT